MPENLKTILNGVKVSWPDMKIPRLEKVSSAIIAFCYFNSAWFFERQFLFQHLLFLYILDNNRKNTKGRTMFFPVDSRVQCVDFIGSLSWCILLYTTLLCLIYA